MRIDVLTIFPDLFTGFLATSIPANAIREGALSCLVHDNRAHAANKHRKVDDRPFGGGPGMVMMCQPIFDAVKAAESEDSAAGGDVVRVLLSPQGERLTQPRVEWLAKQPRLAKLEVVRRGDARRAKLFYLRDRFGKSRRLRDQRRGLKHVDGAVAAAAAPSGA